MMARLPTDETVRRTASPQRQIQGYESQAVANAQIKSGQQMMQTGQRMQITAARQEQKDQDEQTRLALADSKTRLYAGQTDILNNLSQDQDYASLEKKYTTASRQHADEIASKITDPKALEYFKASSDMEIEQGRRHVLGIAQQKKVDQGRAWLDSNLEQLDQLASVAPTNEMRDAALNNATSVIASARDSGFIDADTAVRRGQDFTKNYAKNWAARLSPKDQLKLLKPVAAETQVEVDQSLPATTDGQTPDAMPKPQSLDGLSPVTKVIKDAADRHGVDGETMIKIASIESGGVPWAKNPKSDAAGLFQFMPATAKQYGLKDPMDPAASADSAARMLKDNGAFLKKSLGRDPAGSELYLAQQQGASGATALLKNPDKPAVQVLIDANVNPEKARKSIELNGGSPDMTAGQFTDLWKQKFDGDAANKLTDVNVPYFKKTGTPIDYLPPQERLQMYHQAQIATRADLEARVRDATTMAQQGIPDPNPPTREDFDDAYGVGEGAVRYQQFAPVQQFGHDMKSVATMTPTAQAALLIQRKPVAGPGFTADQQRYDSMVKAVQSVNKMRQDDPMGYAQQFDLAPKEPLAFNDQQSLIKQLQQRTVTATALGQTYNVPQNAMTSSEAKQLGAVMDKSSPNEKLAWLETIRSGVSDPVVYRQTMQQIRPDSPVTAMAGSILNTPKNYATVNGAVVPANAADPNIVARNLVIGEALLNPVKSEKAENGTGKPFPMPADTGSENLRTEFQSVAGNAFRNRPSAADQTYQAVRAYYAALASQSGNYSGKYDSDIGAAAISAVTGSMVERNGATVIPPYGMDESTFLDHAQARYDQALKQNGYDPQITRWDDAVLENRDAPGTYRVQTGQGYLLDKNHRPIIIDFNAPMLVKDQARRVMMVPGPKERAAKRKAEKQQIASTESP